MKSKKMLAVFLASTLALSTVFAGCASKKTNETNSAQEQIDKEQVLKITGGDHKSLDPSKVSDAVSFTTMTQIFEGLTVETEEKGVVSSKLAGASKIEKSTDGLTYTFTIRDSKWSDGKPVTAKDYEFSWKRLCNPKISEDYLGFLEEIAVKNAGPISKEEMSIDKLGVTAKDDKTLVVTLEHPCPYFESALNFKGLVPQREDIASKLGDQYGIDYKNMVYNGPFILSEYQKGSSEVFVKNENYWDAKNVKLQKAECPIVTEPATISKMFDAGELDVAGFSGDFLIKYTQRADKGEFTHITGVNPTVFYFIYNMTNKYLKNVKIRQALSLVINRQELLDTIYKRNIAGTGMVTNKITLGGKEFRKEVQEPLAKLKDDPKKLFAEGLKEIGVNDPSQVNLVLKEFPQNTTVAAEGQYLQDKWQKALGIKIDLKFPIDYPTYYSDRSNCNFDICVGGWGADYNDVASFYIPQLTGNGNNSGKYSNAEYDRLVNEAGKTLDPAKRLDLYKKAEEIATVTDPAICPYFYRDTHQFRHKYVKGLYLPLFGGTYDLRNAYIQGKETK